MENCICASKSFTKYIDYLLKNNYNVRIGQRKMKETVCHACMGKWVSEHLTSEASLERQKNQ